jgi:hypothetical protein
MSPAWSPGASSAGCRVAGQEEARNMSANLNRRGAALIALLLVVGSLVLAGCGSTEPVGVPEGPGMLYFYAEW